MIVSIFGFRELRLRSEKLQQVFGSGSFLLVGSSGEGSSLKARFA